MKTVGKQSPHSLGTRNDLREKPTLVQLLALENNSSNINSENPEKTFAVHESVDEHSPAVLPIKCQRRGGVQEQN